ncbi:DNA-binding GntR family transcriptional regulator [Herbaspirillum sp. Sphag1AN]|uniref:GntR family transcriptional regulator n=1 Tax=unclassified Herbaspirillum TaxID=2624150 RepID=UPI001613949F|nr:MULTISPECIES: GntR family transcriptional regulator [unclassified Herbaspirillum]MBB3213818.1 DNA-binding GntR family transcriptional regulator [Herbaspirillum sp. Sphag1AN]MBB3247015.1 DNA-binding GntR family transcriptional regulator [Herbaspirillum sp. Sphag64]
MPKVFKTIEQHVLNQLRNDILSGHYRPGDKLRQDEVAKRFEVSTTPVREAFRGLRSEGLVSIDANKGVVVKGLTVDDVAEIYELRIALEPLLAKKAVRSITPESLKKAQDIHALMCATTDPHQWSALNREFHLRLMLSEESSRLYDMVKNLLVIAEPYVSLSIFIHPQIQQADNDEHAMILEGFEKKDGRLVQKIVKQHLAQTLAAIQDSVKENDLQALGEIA